MSRARLISSRSAANGGATTSTAVPTTGCGSMCSPPSTRKSAMSDPNSLRERIAAIFASALHLDVPSWDTDLFDTGVLDSLAFVELLLQLEREFGVTTV